MFTTTPLALIKSGAQAFTIANTPQKLTSNTPLASSIDVSRSGMRIPQPALLTSTSKRFSVLVLISDTQLLIDSADVTSKAKTSTCGRDVRESGILEGLRAVAKTWHPAPWNACANATPRPPALHPVTRTVLRRDMAICYRQGRWQATEVVN